MNYYFLVEGKKTEMLFYPRLIEWLSPEYHQVEKLNDISHNSFFMFSGLGNPSIFNKIPKALKDIEIINKDSKYTKIKIDILFVVVDSDCYDSYDAAKRSVKDRIARYHDFIKDANVKVIPIIQQQCIESWFLGNPNIIPSKYSDKLQKLIDYYDVSVLDPELMISNDTGKTNGKFAFGYLWQISKENNWNYSKSYIEDVSSDEYIESIYQRSMKGDQLKSFNQLVELLKKYNKLDTLK